MGLEPMPDTSDKSFGHSGDEGPGAAGPERFVRRRTIRFSATPSGAGAAKLNVTVPKSGAFVSFFVRGATASNADPGVLITARWRPLPLGPLSVVGRTSLMVRIRKNVNSLTTGERNRLIAALAQLNNQGLGRYADFAGTHVAAGSPEAHGRPGFLPWHRRFVVDLERELQAIDRSVSLPYWRFDQPAGGLFTPDFMGQGNGNNPVIFSASNPLQFWKIGSVPGIARNPLFNVAFAPPGPLTQAQALALGNPGATFANFRRLESIAPKDYHGQAHVSFVGPIDSIPTAAQDPLFFLLHSNVDHAWALWQHTNARFDIGVAASWDTNNPGGRVGHNLPDTMWPWNGVTTPPRPNFALGGTLATSPCVTAPGPQPRVEDVFDYQGVINLANNMGFSYDDVPL
jgi:tyrosinase